MSQLSSWSFNTGIGTGYGNSAGVSASFYINDQVLASYKRGVATRTLNSTNREVVESAKELVESRRRYPIRTNNKRNGNKRLRDAFVVNPATNFNKEMYFSSVANTAFHAKFVHEGSPPHEIAARRSSYLAIPPESRREPDNGWIIARRVTHPGIQNPNPFLRDAAQMVISRGVPYR